MANSITRLASFALFLPTVLSFAPCPLLGPSYPAFVLNNNDKALIESLKVLEKNFTDLVTTHTGENGDISPNTSFSVALFSSNNGTAADEPVFWQFDYTSPALKESSPSTLNVSENSIYGIGGLTEVFTVWSLLIEDGDIMDDPVTKHLPELANTSTSSADDLGSLKHVQWDQITVGQLASHMSGLARDYCPTNLTEVKDISSAGFPKQPASQPACCGSISECSDEEFIKHLGLTAPVAPAGYTPTYSNLAFQVLGYLLEKRVGKPFEEIIQDQIFSKLHLNDTTIFAPQDSSHGVIPVSKEASGWSTRNRNTASRSIFSSTRDLAAAGQAILDSRLLSPALTRRWLKPVAQTSNPANSMSAPWSIYSESSAYSKTGIMVDVYNILSTEGHNDGLYSSYLGLVPSYGVGFAILSADTESPADLNPQADYLSGVVEGLTLLAASQAAENFKGAYSNSSSHSNTSISVSVDKLPGLSIEDFISRGVDFKQTLAELLDIKNGTDLSIRLFPTERVHNGEKGSKQAFRAVFQDKTALADAGTATCISWMDVDKLQYNGHGLDEFVFTLDSSGKAVEVEIPALQATLRRGN